MKSLSRALLCGVLAVATLADRNHAQEIDLTKLPTSNLSAYEAFIKRHAPAEDAFIAVQRLAALPLKNREWEKAVAVFETYRTLFPAMAKRFAAIIAVLQAKEESLTIANLGAGINTGASEYLPVPSADGLQMYFTGMQRPGGYGGEDIFVAELQNGVWQEARNLGANLNTKTNEAIFSLSADGTRIVLFGHFKASLGRGDNFYVDKTASGWGAIQHFPAPSNSEYFDADGFMTSDGKALLFSSDRPGSVGDFRVKPSSESPESFHGSYWGNTDIYVCLRTETGWSAAVNLGAMINTPYAERSPYLHPDGKTLFFSSDGHPGLGELDVFKVERLQENSWTEWSEPVNLGKQINTISSDWGYTISTSGDLAFFSASDKPGGYGEDDVYSITLPKAARPEIVATIRGRVVDSDGRPLAAEIKWEDLGTGKNVGQLKTDPRDGGFFIALPLGKNYGYYAEASGYYPSSKNLDLQNATAVLHTTEDIALKSLEEITEDSTATVAINNIFFDVNEYTLRPQSYPELNRLAKILNEKPDWDVVIEGHTDDQGPAAHNLKLSQQRAETVVMYLAAAGCNSENLNAKGYGETQPLTSNATEAGRQQNRRVEFRLISASTADKL